jgi:adenylate cyclase
MTTFQDPFPIDSLATQAIVAVNRGRNTTMVISPLDGFYTSTRADHSIRVADNARSLARKIIQDKPTELIAYELGLRHDGGHGPFGHQTEETLNELMQVYEGSFSHGDMGVKIAQETLASREVVYLLRNKHKEYEHPIAKLVNDYADDIDWVAMDMMQGILNGIMQNSSGLLDLALIQKLQLLMYSEKIALGLDPMTIDLKKTIDEKNENVLFEIADRLEDYLLECVVKASNREKVCMSPDDQKDFDDMKAFLRKNYYQSPIVKATNIRADFVVRKMFKHLMNLSEPEFSPYSSSKNVHKAERVCEFIARLDDVSFSNLYTNIFGSFPTYKEFLRPKKFAEIVQSPDRSNIAIAHDGEKYYSVVTEASSEENGDLEIRRKVSIEITEDQANSIIDKSKGEVDTKASSMEIERKFVVKKLPGDLDKYPSKSISQGYVLIANDGTECRVRRKGTEYFQTIKMGKGLSRKEIEIEISEEQFNQLWNSTKGRNIEKIRHSIPYHGYTLEVDEYYGENPNGEGLNGLITVEVEFSSIDESSNFQAPDWFGLDVTEDKRYKNQYLAVYGMPQSK